MAQILGQVTELRPSMVDSSAIGNLRTVLESKPDVFIFDCKYCGSERTSSVVDPGLLMFKEYACSDEKKRCKTPMTPRAIKRFYTFRPGSLVLAPLNQTEKTMWPGVIEDCPDGSEKYLIPGKSPDSAKAYFVTFIFPKGARKWRGGYLAAKEIRPFEDPKNLRSPHSDSPEFRASILRAEKAKSLSLKQRLLKFSFVAHVAASRNIHLPGGSPTGCWSRLLCCKRRTQSSEDECVPGSKKQPSVDEPSYTLAKLRKVIAGAAGSTGDDSD